MKENILEPHKCSLRLYRVRKSHTRKWGGTLTFVCESCGRHYVYKRSKIHKLILGHKYKRYGSHMRCS